MNRFREALKRHRSLMHAFVALQSFLMMGGAEALQGQVQRREEAVQADVRLSQALGLPPQSWDRDKTAPWVKAEEVFREIVGETWHRAALGAASWWEDLSVGSFSEGGGGAAPKSPVEPVSVATELPAHDQTAGLQFLGTSERKTAATRKREIRRPDGSADAEVETLPVRRLHRTTRAQTEGTLPKRLEVSSAIAGPSPPRAKARAASPEILALVESLGRSPGRILRHVYDHVEFDPKWGADSPPVGTLWEGRGTSWDQAWLLQEMLLAAGVDARLEWGEVQVSPALLMNLTGVADPWRAADLLTTSGVPIVLVVSGSQAVAARMHHVWVKAHLDYIPNRGATEGSGDTWIRLDPTLGSFELDDGIRLEPDLVFSLEEYLTSGTEESPRFDYEGALLVEAAEQGITVASVSELGTTRRQLEESFPYVPGTLKGEILGVMGESESVPAQFQPVLEVAVRTASGQILASWSGPLPTVYSQRLELTWPGATSADQSTLDLYGGVFAAPPYEVDLRPVLRLGETELASGTPIGSAQDVELTAWVTSPDGISSIARWDLYAGEHGVLGFGFGPTPDEVIASFSDSAATATEAEAIEGWRLAEAAATYLDLVEEDLEHQAALQRHRPVLLGAAVLAVQRGLVSRLENGEPDTFARGPLTLEIGALPVGVFPADGQVVSTVPILELLGSQTSVREAEVLTAVFGGEHVTAVGLLTRAVREGQTLRRIDDSNVDAELAAVELSADAEASIEAGVARGLIAWAPEAQLRWEELDTTGYVLEDPLTGASGYFVTYERYVPALGGVVEFLSPTDLEVITQPTDVVATITVPDLQTWTLSTRPTGEPAAAVGIASGIGPVEERLLGQFDPTLLLNGMHELVLTGTTAEGNNVTGAITVVVEGGMKIGNFSLSFVDLAVPVSGLDLEVVRTYDTRQAAMQGDFGQGWSLDLRQGSYRNNRPPGDGWQILSPGGPFVLPCIQVSESKSHLTTIRLSDREIYRFALRIVDGRASTGGGCYGRAKFEYVDGPIPGASLAIVGNDQVYQETPSIDRVLSLDSLDTYVPENVRLRTRDGRVFDLNLSLGVTRVEDRNGNQLTITENGIEHSAGLVVSFERDAEGRITRIVDLAGETFEYRYDTGGDLVGVSDQAGRSVEYLYREGHYLESIRTSDGKTLLTADYDPDDRLTRHCNALLECSQIERDLANRLEWRTDPTDRTVEYRYDSRGNVVAVKDGLGNETRFEYDAKDRMTALEDPLGARTTWTYDGLGDLLEQVEPHEEGEDPADYTTTMTYDGQGSLVSVVRPGGITWSLGRDAAGNLLDIRDGDGQQRFFARYDGRGALVAEGNRFGEMQFLDLQSFGEPARVVDAFGDELLVEYDTAGRVTRLTEGTEVSLHQYDASGEETRADYGDGFWHETDYDGLGRFSTQRSSIFGDLDRQLDAAGRPAGWSYSAGSSVSYERDAAGRLLASIDPAGRRTEIGYDEAGRVTRRIDPGGAATILELDAAGRTVAATDALNHRTELEYHVSGRLKILRDPLGREWTFSRGPTHNETEDPIGRVTRIELGPEGEVTRQVYADGTESTVEYLAGAPYGERADFPTRFVDEAGEAQALTYDDFGRLASASDPTGGVWSFGYAVDDTFTATAPSGETVLTEGWNERGDLVRRGYGDGTELQLSYGLAPDPTGILKPSGAQAALAYDALGRLMSQSVSAGESETFAWAPEGQLQGHTDSTGSTSYKYDARGSLAAVEHADGTRVEYGRDLLGRVTELRVREPGSGTVHTTSYGYDAVSNLTSVTDPTGATTTFSYDQGNRLVGQVRPNGVETEISYDLRDRITSIAHQRGDGTVLASFAYERGPRGEPLRITREDDTAIDYEYDAALRVTAERRLDGAGTVVDETTWEYDVDGRRTAEVENGRRLEYHYLAGNRLSEVRDGTQVVESYGWDVDGRLVSITRDGETLALAYDFEDQLVSVTDSDGQVEYSYDATGRRIQAAMGSEARRFAVAPGSDEAMDLVHGVHHSTDGWAGYVWAGSLPLARYRGGAAEYYLPDAMGSVVAVVDSSGLEVERLEYEAFGEDRSGQPSTDHVAVAGGAIRFQAQWLDAESALYHLRARVYDPATGRFLTRDPVDPEPAAPETFDPYQFARSTPLVFSDPLGLFSMGEVNIASLVSSIMSSIRSAALTMVKQQIKQELGAAVSNIFMKWLSSVLGVAAADFRFPAGLPFWRLGNILENVVQDVLCGALNGSPDLAYFEPRILQTDGTAFGDGYTCSQRPGSRTGPTKLGSASFRFPDLLLRQRPPSTSPLHGTLVISEIKLSVGTFYNAWFRPGLKSKSRKGQWRAIWKHAAGYSYPPRALLLISLRPGAKWQHDLLRREWRSKGLLGRLLTIL